MMLDRGTLDRSPMDRADGITPTPARYVEPIEATFGGSLAAGKTVCIDGQDFSVLNDSVNAIGDFDGEFPLVAAEGAIIYSDSETSRNVTIACTAYGPPDTTPVAPTLTLVYAGSLGAGETLEIDANDFTVEKAGVSDLANFSGDWPLIGSGTNTITYTDSAGSRNVTIAVQRKERSV
jgi:hypothetical protein